MIAGVRSDERVLGEHIGHRLEYRNQQFLLGAGAVGLRLDYDLVAVIHRCHARIALDDAFGGRHLGTVIVSAVTLANAPSGSATVLGMLGEPLTNLGGVALQAFDALLLLGMQLGFDGLVIVFAMAREHHLHGGLELARLAFEVGPGAALRLRSVREPLNKSPGAATRLCGMGCAKRGEVNGRYPSRATRQSRPPAKPRPKGL